MQSQTLAIRCSRLKGLPAEPVKFWHSSLTVRPSFNFAVAFTGADARPIGLDPSFPQRLLHIRRKAALVSETVDDYLAVQQSGGDAVFDAETSPSSPVCGKEPECP